MLEAIATLEGAAETLQGGREASIVRTKLQEARLAETERLRMNGEPHDEGYLDELSRVVERGRDRGRRGDGHIEFSTAGMAMGRVGSG